VQYDGDPRPLHVRNDLPDQFDRVQHLCRALLRAAREIEKAVQQPLHVLDIAAHRLCLVVIQHGKRQPKPRQRGAHVMADPRQHQRALFDLPLDPGAHVDKGLARRAQLCRALGPVGHVSPAPERLGGLGKPGNRAQLVAHVDKRDHRHQYADAHHVDEEKIRAARRQQSAGKAQLEQLFLIAKVHMHILPVRQFHPRQSGNELAHLPDNDDPRKIVPSADVLRGQRIGGNAPDGNAERLCYARILGAAHQPDLARHAAGQLLCHAFEMTLNDHDGHHQQQGDHRHQQAERRPAMKAARQVGFEPSQNHG
jgi:hypothetical protein